MNNKLELLAQRRAMLANKAAEQRLELSFAVDPLRTSLGYADQGMKAYKFISRHPALVTGAVALAFFVIPKHWLAFLQKSLMPVGLTLVTRYLTRD